MTFFFSPSPQATIIILNSFIILGWIVFSFRFWQALRSLAVDEERIFDLSFYSTINAVVFGRLGYVLGHQELFTGKSPLLILALWIAPGLSWLAALVGGIITLIYLSKGYKVRLGYILDALAVSMPLSMCIGYLGSFLGMYEIGRTMNFPWGIRLPNETVLHHPVALYECIALGIIFLVISRVSAVSIRNKWPYGLVGVWFFFMYSGIGFLLEFMKESRVYWGNLTANQWMLIGIFAECIGILYVRGGGRQSMRYSVTRIRHILSAVYKRIYESISKRNSRGDTVTP